MDCILNVRDLTYAFRTESGTQHVLRGVSLKMERGVCLALVGESGSGKSVFVKSLLNLNAKNGAITGGSAVFDDGTGSVTDLAALKTEKEWLQVRGKKIAMVMQDPMSCLNPLKKIGDQIREAVELHSLVRGKRAKEMVLALLRDVQIDGPERRYHQYPHELSGGMRQRVVIAAALACRPELLVCDEPTTSLDAVTQEEILKILQALKDRYQLSILFITHDIHLAGRFADRIAVMHEGVIAEAGDVTEVMRNPQHSYTRSLLTCADEAPLSETAGESGKKLLELDGIDIAYGAAGNAVTVIKDLSLDIREGETLGLVGESGSGKTTLARAICRILPLAKGEIRFDGRRISGKLARADVLQTAGEIQLIFQDPMNSLNERAKVGYIVSEGLYAAGRHEKREEIRQKTGAVLRAVGLKPEDADRFPHEFSGGQRQRIAIARALIVEPKLIIADEPVSSLDAPVRLQILELIKRLCRERKVTCLLITHDLRTARHFCDRIAVLRRGEIVELAGTETLFRAPRHPYTRELLAIPGDL